MSDTPTTDTVNTVCSDWCTAYQVQICGTRFENIDPYILANAITDASSLLWRKTGKRWPGVCVAEVRPPCGRRYAQFSAPVWGTVASDAATDGWGEWAGFGAYCTCDRPLTRTCCCGGPSQVTLGRGPILEIIEVTVDGAVLDPACYRTDDYKWLIRLPDLDGTPASWPTWQRMDLPPTEADTWSVLFSYGGMPPPEGVRAAARLAGELALDRCGGACDLPANLSSASRENLQFTLAAIPDDAWEAMPRSVRAFVATANPNNLQRSARLFSPDNPTPSGIRTNT